QASVRKLCSSKWNQEESFRDSGKNDSWHRPPGVRLLCGLLRQRRLLYETADQDSYRLRRLSAPEVPAWQKKYWLNKRESQAECRQMLSFFQKYHRSHHFYESSSFDRCRPSMFCRALFYVRKAGSFLFQILLPVIHPIPAE